MSEWLELELADQLAPVRAPERLWQVVRAERPRAVVRRRPVKAVLLVAAAAAASVWIVAAWRPESRSVRTVPLSASSMESHMACRSCHTD